MNLDKICPQCGKNNPVDKRFCVECGARLQDRDVALAGDQETTSLAHEQAQVIDLVQQITDPAAGTDGNVPQEEGIARLVQMGPEAVPAVADAVWAAIRDGERDPSGIGNVGLLCEAIGRMGGNKAFDVLARFAVLESTTAEYAHIRAGAIRGLAHLDDRRAGPLLVAALCAPEESVRIAASNALAKVGDASTVELLKPLVADENQDVRAAALEAVIRIGGRKRQTTKRLTTAVHVGFFLLGAALFSISIGMMWAAVRFDLDFLFFVGVGFVMLLILLALKGLDWHPGGIYDWHARVVAVIFLLLTGIGVIPVCYWSGKGVVRWYLGVFA